MYRLRFENNPNLPIISVFAQAPTVDEAKALAAAAPAALHHYVSDIQRQQDTPKDDQVVITRLGQATGGVVNKGANLQISLLVFIAVLIGWCLLLIPAQTIARGWREIDAEEGASINGNGDVARGPAGPRKRAKRSKGERVH